MRLIAVAENIFTQMEIFLRKIEKDSYRASLDIFSGSSIGEHTRHVIEYFLCLIDQLHTGYINYDNRLRRKELQEEPSIALLQLQKIRFLLTELSFSGQLAIKTTYGASVASPLVLSTTPERELLYNIEHAIHHLAMIKIGLKSVAPYIVLPQDFGVAQSTIDYSAKIQTVQPC